MNPSIGITTLPSKGLIQENNPSLVNSLPSSLHQVDSNNSSVFNPAFIESQNTIPQQGAQVARDLKELNTSLLQLSKSLDQVMQPIRAYNTLVMISCLENPRHDKLDSFSSALFQQSSYESIKKEPLVWNKPQGPIETPLTFAQLLPSALLPETLSNMSPPILPRAVMYKPDGEDTLTETTLPPPTPAENRQIRTLIKETINFFAGLTLYGQEITDEPLTVEECSQLKGLLLRHFSLEEAKNKTAAECQQALTQFFQTVETHHASDYQSQDMVTAQGAIKNDYKIKQENLLTAAEESGKAITSTLGLLAATAPASLGYALLGALGGALVGTLTGMAGGVGVGMFHAFHTLGLTGPEHAQEADNIIEHYFEAGLHYGPMLGAATGAGLGYLKKATEKYSEYTPHVPAKKAWNAAKEFAKDNVQEILENLKRTQQEYHTLLGKIEQLSPWLSDMAHFFASVDSPENRRLAELTRNFIVTIQNQIPNLQATLGQRDQEIAALEKEIQQVRTIEPYWEEVRNPLKAKTGLPPVGMRGLP